MLMGIDPQTSLGGVVGTGAGTHVVVFILVEVAVVFSVEVAI